MARKHQIDWKKNPRPLWTSLVKKRQVALALVHYAVSKGIQRKLPVKKVTHHAIEINFQQMRMHKVQIHGKLCPHFGNNEVQLNLPFYCRLGGGNTSYFNHLWKFKSALDISKIIVASVMQDLVSQHIQP
jgi:hypothetical protein